MSKFNIYNNLNTYSLDLYVCEAKAEVLELVDRI